GNIIHKKIDYFLFTIRSLFQLDTMQLLEERFIKQLSSKAGVGVEETKHLMHALEKYRKTKHHQIEDVKIVNNMIEDYKFKNKMDAVRTEVKKVIVGQERAINMLLISILAGGHALIEGLPGVAKTLTAKLIAKAIDCDFKRIQFTPDLMPSDVTGSSILDLKSNEFEFRRGPIFGNIVLIDEINRAPAKTQASLFECMSERQVTVDGQTFSMASPFVVFATQNPI